MTPSFSSSSIGHERLTFVAGKVRVTDVIYPGGSPELVEPIYKNPILSAPFIEQLTAVTRAYVIDRLQVLPAVL
jgi:hypothetical protein